MGEVRIISGVESAKARGGNELPKPLALVVVQWIGFIWVAVILLRGVWSSISFVVSLCGDGNGLGDFFVDIISLGFALTMFIPPFLAMYFCMKGSRYFVPIFCTMGAMMACYSKSIPGIVLLMGFVPSLAIWVCPSIRKWYDSLA